MRRQVMPKLRAFIDHVNSRSPAKRLPERELPDNPGQWSIGSGWSARRRRIQPGGVGDGRWFGGEFKTQRPKNIRHDRHSPQFCESFATNQDSQSARHSEGNDPGGGVAPRLLSRTRRGSAPLLMGRVRIW